MKCPKCGSEDQYSGATILDTGIQYDFGCEDCKHWVVSDEFYDFMEAVNQAKERFTK